MKIIKVISLCAAVLAGLVPAILLVRGSDRLLSGVSVSFEVGSVRTPDSPITVRFSEPVDTGSFQGKISIIPETPLLYAWSDDRMTLSLKARDRFLPGRSYRLLIAEGKAGFGKSVPAASMSFSIPDYPEVVSVTPSDGAADVLLGIEDPITVQFDRSVDDFFIDFRFTPDLSLAVENDDAKRVFRLMPEETLSSGTEYVLSIYAKWRDEGDDRYVILGSIRFTTRFDRPAAWSKDPVERVAEVKAYARPLVATGKYIDIDLAAQVMSIYEDGKSLDAFPISSGKPGMETPKGTYKIENKANRPYSKEYGLYMPYWMALVPSGKFGIHELPEWPSGYKEGANHLGIPVSHGCVRLGVGPAKRVFDFAEIGTPVVVH